MVEENVYYRYVGGHSQSQMHVRVQNEHDQAELCHVGRGGGETEGDQGQQPRGRKYNKWGGSNQNDWII